jgi:hypothetical protein
MARLPRPDATEKRLHGGRDRERPPDDRKPDPGDRGGDEAAEAGLAVLGEGGERRGPRRRASGARRVPGRRARKIAPRGQRRDQLLSHLERNPGRQVGGHREGDRDAGERPERAEAARREKLVRKEPGRRLPVGERGADRREARIERLGLDQTRSALRVRASGACPRRGSMAQARHAAADSSSRGPCFSPAIDRERLRSER